MLIRLNALELDGNGEPSVILLNPQYILLVDEYSHENHMKAVSGVSDKHLESVKKAKSVIILAVADLGDDDRLYAVESPDEIFARVCTANGQPLSIIKVT